MKQVSIGSSEWREHSVIAPQVAFWISLDALCMNSDKTP